MAHIPQIQAILPLTRDGSLRLNKLCRQYLKAGSGERLSLLLGDEVLLARAGVGPEATLDEKGRLWLPDAALSRLGCKDGHPPDPAFGPQRLLPRDQRKAGMSLHDGEVKLCVTFGMEF